MQRVKFIAGLLRQAHILQLRHLFLLRRQLVDLLLLHGADVARRDKEGKTAMERCAAGANGKQEVIQEMLRKAS